MPSLRLACAASKPPRLAAAEPVAGLPDLVFTANAGLVDGSRFVVSRFRHQERRGEARYDAKWFAAASQQVRAGKTAAEAVAARLNALELTIHKKTGENDQLYGSVTNADIAELLATKGFEIDRRKILLPDPIKTLGENTVPVKLHRDVTAQVKVTVAKDS